MYSNIPKLRSPRSGVASSDSNDFSSTSVPYGAFVHQRHRQGLRDELFLLDFADDNQCLGHSDAANRDLIACYQPFHVNETKSSVLRPWPVCFVDNVTPSSTLPCAPLWVYRILVTIAWPSR